MGNIILKKLLLVAAILTAFCGVYFMGYRDGKKETKIEYITREVEIEKIKYVEKEKKQARQARIYSKPSPDFNAVADWLRNSATKN